RYEWAVTGEPPVVADPVAWAGEVLRQVGVELDPNPGAAAEPIPERVPEGTRNVTLTSLAGSLRRRGLSQGVIEAALAAVNERVCVPPLPEEEVRRIAASVSRYAPAQATPGLVEAPEEVSSVSSQGVFSVSSQGVSSVNSQPPLLSTWRSTRLVRVPGFPLHVLPPGVRQYVEEVSEGIQCPPDLVAVPLLGASGAVWGNRLAIRVTSTWVERAVIWAAVVAEPGSAKSPALEAALAPLVALQQAAYKRWTAEMERWKRELAATRKDRSAPPPPPQPDLEHYFTSDATLEALARILGETPTPGLVVVMDELAAWVNGFDAYHQRGERQRWLSLWSGGALKVDRATRGPVFLGQPVVCVVGGIVPDCLHLLEAEARLEDGFVDRLLYAFPDTRPMRFVDAPPPQADLVPVFQGLRSCPVGEVVLSEEAREVFAGYVDDNARAQELESFRPLRRYRAKLPRHLARLALVLHCLHHPEDPTAHPVAAETVAAAVELTEYFLGHARRVLLEFGDGALARKVLGALVAAGGQLSLSQLYAELGGHVRAPDLRAVRDFLVAQGAIEVVPLEPGPRGGRPSEAWRLTDRGDLERGTPCEETEETPCVESGGHCEETEETGPQARCTSPGGTPIPGPDPGRDRSRGCPSPPPRGPLWVEALGGADLLATLSEEDLPEEDPEPPPDLDLLPPGPGGGLEPAGKDSGPTQPPMASPLVGGWVPQAPAPRTCIDCGAPLPPDNLVRCEPCVARAWQEVWGEPPPPKRQRDPALPDATGPRLGAGAEVLPC
ncbi:MAG: DUF3987 domain-containing protein, partial [Armatimonadota bacterium]|nr:DUF3987 domain-containing protein [Armatimonadota bacterium]